MVHTSTSRPGRLLLADDDAVLRETMRLVLEPHVSVSVAGSVQAGRRALADGDFDVLVTDFELGDGTGAELLAEAKQRRIYSILVTGKSGFEEVRRLQQEGALILFKPADPAELVSWVRSGLTFARLNTESKRLVNRTREEATRRRTMFDLTKFTLSDMSTLSSELRNVAGGADTLEEVASRVVKHLRATLGDEHKAPAVVLARFYKTVPFGALDADLQQFGRTLMSAHTLTPTTQCLTLLGTEGGRPEWCSRKESRGHKTIPLPSEKVVQEIPMIAQLVRQLGVAISDVIAPQGGLVVDAHQKSYNVFHVPDAVGSPYIPAQDFVKSEGVRSVLGFGGVLPSGAGLFAVILFCRVTIPKETAQMFRTASLSVKMAALPHLKKVFA